MRHEFTKKTMREALARAGDGDPHAARCEAMGEVYGLLPGHRCNAGVSKAKEFDHYPLPAGDEGSDSLDNCVVCCLACHRWKTSHYDVPVLAKGKRASDDYLGIKVSRNPLPGSRASGLRKRMSGKVERW